MKQSDAERLKDPAALRDAVSLGIGDSSPPGAHGHGQGHGPGHGSHEAGLVSTREAVHAGCRIVIRTTYDITVDGKPLTTHLHVTQDGDLHSHALPNYQFHSAVDMVKKIIDLFPDEFTCSQPGHDHGGHSHQHP